MPLATIYLCKPKPAALKFKGLYAALAALVASGVPQTDKFQRVIELAPEDFRFDPSYSDLQSSRDQNFVLLELLWSLCTSAKAQRKLLTESCLNPENGVVSFKGTNWVNWTFGGGRAIRA